MCVCFFSGDIELLFILLLSMVSLTEWKSILKDKKIEIQFIYKRVCIKLSEIRSEVSACRS